MHCRNCGNDLAGAVELCPSCGARPAAGRSYCPSCGAATTPMTEICTRCGVRIRDVLKQRTWMPTVAGILTLIAGGGQLLGGLGIAIAAGLGGAIWGFPWISILAAPLIALGAVAVAGGIYALKRQLWGLALAGAIAVLLTGNLILGILSLIFIIMSKREFE